MVERFVCGLHEITTDSKNKKICQVLSLVVNGRDPTFNG